MTEPSRNMWRSRAMIVGIALISFVPFGIAWYYARHPELIEQRSNYGSLFIPPPQVDVGAMVGRPLERGADLSPIRGRWVLLHLGARQCDRPCAETLHKTHQARLMLNKEIQRVKRVLLVPAETSPESISQLLREDGDLMAALEPSGLIPTITAALGRSPAPNTVLLMDPLGNLVLWYAPDFDPYKLLKDLKHLLKASQIG